MNCRKFRQALYLNREGELNPDEARALTEHVAGCRHCAKEKAAADRLAGITRDVARMDLTPEDPQGLTRRILQRTSVRKVRVPLKEGTFNIDRFLEFLSTPAFRLASSTAIALITIFFLTQSYVVLRDVRDLEASQQRSVESVSMPHVNFAVDVRPLQGTPEGALLKKLEGRPAGGYIIVNDRHASVLRAREYAFLQKFPGRPMLEAQSKTIEALVSYLKENVHPVLSFTREGVSI
jgi:hypothetical protein